MKKPLARWTIGPVKKVGYRILESSVDHFGKLYPEFDRVLCHNQLIGDDLEWVENFCNRLKIRRYHQKIPEIDCPIWGSGWKLSPPRMRPDAHELWLDNDVLIRGRINEIDEWLKDDCPIISSGLHGKFAYGGGCYGKYIDEIQDHIKACAGFFGLPPGFEFRNKIDKLAAKLDGEPLGNYDEQGLVVSIVSSQRCIFVPMKTLAVVDWEHPLPSCLPEGIHFAGVNKFDNDCDFKPWDEYLEKTRSIMLL